jgi:hypothetical protein
MGAMTDLRTKEWQEKAGIKPATGERLKRWHALQDACFETIKVAELEISGIRDGDGFWHGGDVVSHVWQQLVQITASLKDHYDSEWEQSHPHVPGETPF